MPKCPQCGGFCWGFIEGVCASCKADNEIDEKAIDELKEEGHPYHCAARQVWGDGECECGLYHGKFRI